MGGENSNTIVILMVTMFFFDITKIVDGRSKGSMTVVALDSINSNNLTVNDLGCLNNCKVIQNSASYIGKINNRLRITLQINLEKDRVYGYYYYDKFKKKIPITGVRDNDNFTFFAKVPNGEEVFEGRLVDGKFKGVWTNNDGNKKYSFYFYLKLIQ